jgi:molybdopterin-guanine dinucleotide biosynthesis protein A
MSVDAVILAGGQSTRMGADKAALRVSGRTLLEWVAEAAVAATGAAWVIGREAPDGWPLESVRFATDDPPGRGPLSGLATALGRTGADVLLLACDAPAVTAESIAWLLGQALQSPAADGVVGTRGGRLEPFFAVYRRAVAGRLRARLAGSDLSLHGLIEAGAFDRVEVPRAFADRLVNVNHPEDLARVEALLARCG